MKNLTLEQAKDLYKLGGTAKEFALKFFSEEELTESSCTIKEVNGNVRIKGTIKGFQSNHLCKIEDSQSNSYAKIEGHQFNSLAQVGGNQYNIGLKVEGQMWIDEDTEYKGGIWMLKPDGTDIEMQLIPKE